MKSNYSELSHSVELIKKSLKEIIESGDSKSIKLEKLEAIKFLNQCCSDALGETEDDMTEGQFAMLDDEMDLVADIAQFNINSLRGKYV